MGWWEVNADTLAGSRFVLSPLAETTASLILLERGVAAHPAERAWLDTHRPRYRERLAGDPITALLIRAALRRAWIADIMTRAPAGGGGSWPSRMSWPRSGRYRPAPCGRIWPCPPADRSRTS